MIDIHSHIIFGVDDGPQTLEDSIQLLKEAYRQGIRKIVSTSHRRKGMFETPEATIWQHFLEVKKAAATTIGEDLELYYGGELYYTSDLLDKLEQGQVPTMNATRFCLIEFSKGAPWTYMKDSLQKVILLGLTPIVAHIERYDVLAFDKQRVQDMIKMGCYTQINSNHVLKAKLFGDPHKVFKKRAHYFLKEDLVHCVASDMHNLDSRRPYMEEAYDFIAQKYGYQRAQRLFLTHQESLLENQMI